MGSERFSASICNPGGASRSCRIVQVGDTIRKDSRRSVDTTAPDTCVQGRIEQNERPQRPIEIGHSRMALDPKSAAALALHRFGLGPRPGSIAAIASDPRGALLAEVERPGIGQINDPSLPTAAQAARAAFEDRAARQAKQIVAQRKQKEAERQRAMAAESGDATMEPKPDGAETATAPKPEMRPEPPVAQQIL